MVINTQIKVRITKANKIEVEVIQDHKKVPGLRTTKISTTLGSNRWYSGEFDPFKHLIYTKIREYITNLHLQVEQHIN
jgi:hypothetical protein